jgi:hypothetical protein
MKDLFDYVALGKKLGYSGDDLEKYAEKRYKEYVTEEEKRKKEEEKKEEKRKKDDEERELRLLDRRLKIAEEERKRAESSGAPAGATRSSPHVPAFRFTPFNEKSDDLDSWFTLFEKQCSAYGVKDNSRKAHLLSLFTGQYRDAFLSLDASATYQAVRAHLLQTFNLTKHD